MYRASYAIRRAKIHPAAALLHIKTLHGNVNPAIGNVFMHAKLTFFHSDGFGPDVSIVRFITPSVSFRVHLQQWHFSTFLEMKLR